jgi:hypothetical protein
VQAPSVKRVAGAWEGLMTEEEIDHAFSPEVEAEMARQIYAGVKPKRREKAAVPASKPKRAATTRRAR